MRKEMRIPLIVFIITLIICSYAIADDTRTSGLFTYKLKGNGTITIVDFDWANNSGDIYIPTMLDGYNLTGIGDKAFAQTYGKAEKNPTCSVNIPNTITSIGDFAFENANITFVNIPQSVTHIGKNPFMNCKSLVQISVDPNNTTFASIEGVLYHKGNKSLISYPLATTRNKIPSGIIEIADYACVGCWDWRSTYFPDTLIKIGDYAFHDAGIAVTSVNLLPESVTEIGDYSFYNTNIGVFSKCYTDDYYNSSEYMKKYPTYKKLEYEKGLKKIWQEIMLYGVNVNKIGKGSFKNAHFLASGQNEYDFHKPTIIMIFLGEVPGEEGTSQLASIPIDAFSGIKTGTDSSKDKKGFKDGMLVYLPQKLQAIEENAFENVNTVRCLSGTHIDTVKRNAFQNTRTTGSLTVDTCEPYSFSKINSEFSKWKMSDLTISLNYSAIPDHAFDGSMLSLKVENRLDSVGDYAFFNSAVTQSTKGYAKLGAHAFDGANLPSALEIPNFLSEIGECAFANNPNLLELTLPESVSLIGDNAFDKTIIKLTVSKGSYAEFWAQENGYSYKYADGGEGSLDWLNN